MANIPDGYVVGLSRRRENPQRAHLYKGTYGNLDRPMCRHGYEAAGDWSIFRGNIGPKGICKVCIRRAVANLEPAPWPDEQ